MGLPFQLAFPGSFTSVVCDLFNGLRVFAFKMHLHVRFWGAISNCVFSPASENTPDTRDLCYKTFYDPI